MKKTLRSLFLILLLQGALPGSAGAVEVQRVVSALGIEAWLVEDHSNPILALDFAFEGGAALDPPGKAGLANLASGTIDEGAGQLDSQAFQAELNDLSLTVSFEVGRDAFFGAFRTLTENRDRGFELLRLAISEPRFDPEPLERIRTQIQIGLEREQKDPQAIVGKTLRNLLMPGHPYAWPLKGTPASLAGIDAADLKAFVSRRFGRDNLTVGAVGDITAVELAKRLDEVFGVLPAAAKGDPVPEAEVRSEPASVVVEMDIPQSIVAFGHAGLKRDDEDYYAAYVLNHILGGGSFSSRLYQEIRVERGLAYSVYSYLSPRDHAALMLGGVATQNARVAETLALVRSNWSLMAAEGPTREELALAKTYLTGSFPLRLSSSGAISGMLVGIQRQDLGIDYLTRRNDFIEAVSLEDVRRVAGELLKPEGLTVVVVGNPEGLADYQRRLPDDG